MSKATIALLTMCLMNGCDRARDDVASSRSQLIAPESAGIGATVANQPMQEPSGAFANLRALVVGFNDKSSGNGWAVSTDFGKTFGTQCSFNGQNFLGGPPCPPVPLPPIGAGMPAWNDWAGDPTLVADGRGNVVYVSLANNNVSISGAMYVVAAISANGGNSWASSSIVNITDRNPQSSASPMDCGGLPLREIINPIEDQPNATFDVTTNPPTLWVVWRHGVAPLSGACFRRGVIDTTSGAPTIRWLDAARPIGGLGGTYQDGLVVAAGDGVATVMYAATTTFLAASCPDNGGLFSMDFATVDSFDNGNDWVDNTQVFHSSAHQWCVIGGAANTSGQGQINSGIRDFGFVRTPSGAEYAAVQDTRHTARLFMSPAAGVKGYQNQTSTIRTWFEWCPGTPTSLVANGPTSNWSRTTCAVPAIDSDPSNHGLDLVWPTLAADGRGNIAISDIEQLTNDPAAPLLIDYDVRGIFNPQVAGATLQGPTLMRSATFALPTGGFTRPIGDYGSIAVRPSGSPFAQPGCTTANDFFPLWTANDGTSAGNPQIITRGFSLTPP